MRHKLFLLRSPEGPQVMSEEESMRWLREESDYYVRNESKTHIRAVPGGKTAKTAHRKRNRAKEQLSDAQRQVRDDEICMPCSCFLVLKADYFFTLGCTDKSCVGTWRRCAG